MTIYLDIIRFNFLRFLAYPTEIWAAVIKRILSTGFLIIFWSIIARSSHNTISFVPLLSYFLISSAVNDALSAQSLQFGGYLGELIKGGRITTLLIRPLQIIPYLYSSSLGERSLGLILSSISFVIGILISPPANTFSVLLFIIFLALAAIISFAINLLVGIFYFYSPEARNFLYTFGHVIKVLSGAIVPLTFFPTHIRSIVLLSPFPGMVFTPVTALHISTLDAAIVQNLTINFIWATVLLIIALAWWKKAIRNYDAIGI
jgi:ABC-2 type transport system permease protein